MDRAPLRRTIRIQLNQAAKPGQPVPNRLASATSPYLLQHADNPVDWWEWGEGAFAEARQRDVPVFLSVGYSSCHWCHVMAHESFEDDEVAAYLNAHYVSIKVDREERPDVDGVYMTATQALTGSGGWPMSVFIDHDGRPFHAGTYWPRRRRGGHAAFPEVLAAVTQAWTERREQVEEAAAGIHAQLLERTTRPPAADDLDPGVPDRAAAAAVDARDRRHGGFGRAPKFPQAMLLSFLLDHHARTGDPDALATARDALTALVRGGIHDQLTGGFARYATDAAWRVPHFEKMLYDNGLLVEALADAAALTGDELLVEGAHRTADALLDWFALPSGALLSATDADTEGEEGRFFTFTQVEASAVLDAAGLDAARWTRFLGVTEPGHWEGTNVLSEPLDRASFRADEALEGDDFRRELMAARSALAEARAERVRPGVDDKVLAAWNGLAVRGLVVAGLRLGRPELVARAGLVLDAVLARLHVDGVLHRTWRDGRHGVRGFLDDHALIADAALAIAEVTGDLAMHALAVDLVRTALVDFDDGEGGLAASPADGEQLWMRPREDGDNATPAGASVLVDVLLRLAALHGDDVWRQHAERLLGLVAPVVERVPTAFGEALRGWERLVAPSVEVAVVGPPGPARDALVAAATALPDPGRVTFVADTDSDGTVHAAAAAAVPLLVGRRAVDGGPAAYVCRAMLCRAPVTDPAAVTAELSRVSPPGGHAE